MATLKSIRTRIASVKGTQKLTRAMKMVAAARLFKAQRRVLDARVFSAEAERVLKNIIRLGADTDDPILIPRAEKPAAIDLVLFTSDKGLCGMFNEALLKEAAYFMAEKNGVNVSLFVFGKKGVAFFNRKKVQTLSEFSLIGDKDIQNILSNTMDSLIERFLSGQSDEAVIAYNSFEGVGNFRPTYKRLLPVTPATAEYEHGVDYIYEPASANVSSWLIRKSLMSGLYLAHLESQASELAARMVAMEKATKSADDIIKTLTMKYNRARQYAITKELIDIIGGVEALK